MDTQIVFTPSRLSDSELINRVKDLAGRERQITADLIAHLAELDERRLYRAEGCASLFTYCTEILKLSEYAAFARIEAARAARKYPLVLEKLTDGSVHLTAVGLLARHLTPENHRDLLNEATHKSKRDVEELVARIRPLPAVPSRVRKLPATAAESSGTRALPAVDSGAGLATTPSVESGGLFSLVDSMTTGTTMAEGKVNADVRDSNPRSATPEFGRASARPSVAALSPGLYKVQFSADAETYKSLCQARELLRHQIPGGDAAAVIGLALKVLVEKLTKQKIGAGKRARGQRRAGRRVNSTAAHRGLQSTEPHADRRPAGEQYVARHSSIKAEQPRPEVRRAPDRPAGGSRQMSRYIPAEVRRKVWERDQGRCAFSARDGRRCTERGRLEFHHVVPFALGGAATAENIELRCSAHNAFEAELEGLSRTRDSSRPPGRWQLGWLRGERPRSADCPDITNSNWVRT